MQDPVEIHDRLKGAIDLVIDGGEIYAEPSTVIDLTDRLPKWFAGSRRHFVPGLMPAAHFRAEFGGRTA